jgi:hypothetical protein
MFTEMVNPEVYQSNFLFPFYLVDRSNPALRLAGKVNSLKEKKAG